MYCIHIQQTKTRTALELQLQRRQVICHRIESTATNSQEVAEHRRLCIPVLSYSRLLYSVESIRGGI